jgi:hypothetical protein
MGGSRVGHENSGEDDPSERFRPRLPPPRLPTAVPTQETSAPPLKQGGRAGDQQGARTAPSFHGGIMWEWRRRRDWRGRWRARRRQARVDMAMAAAGSAAVARVACARQAASGGIGELAAGGGGGDTRGEATGGRRGRRLARLGAWRCGGAGGGGDNVQWARLAGGWVTGGAAWRGAGWRWRGWRRAGYFGGGEGPGWC